MSPHEIIKILGLSPLPDEGGFFAPSFQAVGSVGVKGQQRAAMSGIYYLLTPENFSALHRLAEDEVFHFYLGDPVSLLELVPGGEGREFLLGSDLKSGQRLQHHIPAGIWQGSRLVEGGQWALLGCTVAPAYRQQNFSLGVRTDLVAKWPAYRKQILELTR